MSASDPGRPSRFSFSSRSPRTAFAGGTGCTTCGSTPPGSAPSRRCVSSREARTGPVLKCVRHGVAGLRFRGRGAPRWSSWRPACRLHAAPRSWRRSGGGS
jgi:hypothetical protein